MALVSCKECGHEVSTEATKCPSCGARLRKPRRGVFGQIAKWLFILFNVLMVWWLFDAMVGIGEVMNESASEAERTGAAIGGTIGLTFLLIIWALGDIVLGAFVFFTRPKD